MTVDGSYAEERVFIYSEMQRCLFRMRFHAGCAPPSPPPPHTQTHASSHLSHLHPYTTIPRFDQEWEVGYWRGGVGLLQVRQPVLCKRPGLDPASRELTQHAFLPNPGGGTEVNMGQ